MITGLAYVLLRLPDPVLATAYYERVLGLEPVGPALLSARPDDFTRLAPSEVAIEQGTPTLQRVGFEVDSWDGLPPGLMVGDEWRVEGPDGWSFAMLPPRPGVARRLGAAPFSLTRLGHVTFQSPNPKAAAEWMVDRLGFRLSERLDEEFYWLRCNRDHHTIAFALGERPALHHIAFELKDWTAMLHALDHLRSVGQPVEFGPGRHGSGGNLFLYFLDPWGVRHELFCDLPRIDDEASYQTVVQRVDKAVSVNRWGPAAPATFFAQALAKR